MSAKKRSTKGSKPAAAGRTEPGIEARPDWREERLSRVRRLIQQALPAVLEERKWRKPSSSMAGVPVWSHDGILCTGETYKDKVKLTFAHGASLEDPDGLFNASLAGHTRRAIDLRQADDLDEAQFQALVRAAAALNLARAAARKPGAAGATRGPARTAQPKLLAGGNPQIAKGDGDAPVQAFIAAMPGWKHAVGRRLDALIVETVPNVRKAVRWNTPFYGVEGQGWFLGFHCITKYVKVAFLRGAALRPAPPVASKQEHARYLHIHEDESLDEEALVDWIRQAAQLPGEELF